MSYDNISNCTKKELLQRYFSILLTIDGFWTHFDGCFLSSNLELKREMKLKQLPSFLPYLITYLFTYWLTYFIQAPARTILSKLPYAGLKYHKYLSRSSLCYTTWDKMSCHACKKAMLQSKIKKFYYPNSEDSLKSTHMTDVLKIHSKSLKGL